MVEPTQGEVAVRARAETLAELTGERVAVEPGRSLELLGGDHPRELRIEELSRPFDGDRAGSSIRMSSRRRIESEQRVGEAEDDLIGLERLPSTLEIVERRPQRTEQARIGGYRLPHERQAPRPPAESVANEARREVEHPVAEPGGRPGAPVMPLVGVEDDGMAPRAVRPGAAVVEGLDAREGAADGVGVVAVRVVGVPRKERLDPLDAGMWRRGPDPIAGRRRARSFKTGIQGRVHTLLMRFDTKIAIIVREDLAAWQKLNVASFLSGGLVGASPHLAGKRYVDATGRVYGPLVRQPILVFAGSAAELGRALRRAIDRGLQPSIYTAALFATGNDYDNRAAVAAVATDALDLAGLGLHADRKAVDKVTKGLALHP